MEVVWLQWVVVMDRGTKKVENHCSKITLKIPRQITLRMLPTTSGNNICFWLGTKLLRRCVIVAGPR